MVVVGKLLLGNILLILSAWFLMILFKRIKNGLVGFFLKKSLKK